MERLLCCEKCGTIVGKVEGKGEIFCCNKKLKPITYFANEKINPQIEVKNDLVSININCKEKEFDGFIYLKSIDGGQRKVIKNRNNFCFLLCEDKPLSITIVLNNIGNFVMDLAGIYN